VSPPPPPAPAAEHVSRLRHFYHGAARNQDIYRAWVRRENARYSYELTRSPAEAERFREAQREIQRIQHDKFSRMLRYAQNHNLSPEVQAEIRALYRQGRNLDHPRYVGLPSTVYEGEVPPEEMRAFINPRARAWWR
jgi:hypothetical protein